MKYMTRPELDHATSLTITATLELLEELYIAHSDDTISEMNNVRLPFGDKFTMIDLVIQVFRIILPLYDKAKKEWPEATPILEWAEHIYTTVLVSNRQE